MILENLRKLLDRIERSCVKVGRDKESVKILAVTKNVTSEIVEEGIRCGLHDLGESKVQEAQGKFEHFRQKYPQVKWHLLGSLQSNKINRALEIFECIESLDSIDLAGKINLRAGRIPKVQDCLLEVKVSEEATKKGYSPEVLELFWEATRGVKQIRVRGLMCMAPYFEDKELTRPYFVKAAKLFKKYYSNFYQEPGLAPILSMGMSNDFEVAIEEGSTQVRIGTALFGIRDSGRRGDRCP